MAAHSPIMRDVIKFAKGGGRVFGVCNGFQMLVETQLLPGALLKNRDLRFICRHVHLAGQDGGAYKVPVAHGEGNYFANDNIVKALNQDDLIAYRYCDSNGAVLSDEENPNGSIHSIAGIYNKERTILGMMPHPENAALPHHDSHDGHTIIEAMLKELF
jgi:phosphoribosylformylglycinamidine synthase